MTPGNTPHAGPALQRFPSGETAVVLPLLSKPHQQLVAKSVIAGNTHGSFWADDLSRPRLAVLWDEAHHLYVAAEIADRQSATAIQQFLHNTIVPHAREHHVDHYMISPSNTHADALLRQALPGTSRRQRILLRLIAPQPATRSIQDNNLRLRPIDRALLEDDLCHADDLRREVRSMWGSQEAFLQHGFGYCMVADRQIVCWCTAEYVSPGWCGIGIETIQAYQGRGLATVAATAFAQHCLTEGIVPHWDCWADNVRSLRVAQRVGFQTVEQHDVYVAGGASGSGL